MFKKGYVPWNKGLTGESNPLFGRKRLPFSQEWKQKISKRLKGNQYHKGILHTEETKKQISNSVKGEKNGFFGKKHTKETKERLKKLCIGKPSPMEGKNHTEEARRKIREARAKQVITEETRAKMRIARSKRIFPNKDSKIEIKMQNLLDTLHVKYQKHFSVYHPKMNYHQVDIMICDHQGNPKIAIECDGCYWHGCPIHHPTQIKEKERDRIIDECLTELGIKIIRFWEHDIHNNTINLEILNK